MKVFILEADTIYEGSTIVGVFDSKEKAEHVLNNSPEFNESGDGLVYQIYEFEVQ